jgi:adenosine deaminase
MGPPSSIAESLDILEADRIGHGVAAMHDPVLFPSLEHTRSRRSGGPA